MFYILANNLALDLVNTRVVDDHGNEIELLRNFGDLLDWAVATEIITEKQAARSRRERRNDEMLMLITSVLALRSELKLMVEAMAKRKPIPQSSIDLINEILKHKNGFFEVQPQGDAYQKEFRFDLDEIADILLLPIAESAADLLCFGDLCRVKKCEREACVLYFYDTSTRRGRRWCSMSICGNRSKANAFYKRKICQP
jgi:predicted RNA-binding Zn ribbon-like protein